MSYDATVINVMVATPNDVNKEPQIIKDIILDWNSVYSERERIVLMATGWKTHTSPMMGDRPQELINKQVLDKSDLLVAVFWTRLGSPTGESPSGTVEEINRHIEAGKPAMIYFSISPVRPDSVDGEQYEALQKFRRECEERGLIETYESLSEFREKFTRQLGHNILEQFSKEGTAVENKVEIASEADAVPHMSDEAKELLIEASISNDGTVVLLRVMQGMILRSNNKDFGKVGDPRSEAKWVAAVEELLILDLIRDQGGEGEVFSVTNEGFQVAERLQQQ